MKARVRRPRPRPALSRDPSGRADDRPRPRRQRSPRPVRVALPRARTLDDPQHNAPRFSRRRLDEIPLATARGRRSAGSDCQAKPMVATRPAQYATFDQAQMPLFLTSPKSLTRSQDRAVRLGDNARYGFFPRVIWPDGLSNLANNEHEPPNNGIEKPLSAQ